MFFEIMITPRTARFHRAHRSVGSVLESARALEQRCTLALFTHHQLMDLGEESPRHAAQLAHLSERTIALASAVAAFCTRTEELMRARGDLWRAPTELATEVERLTRLGRDLDAHSCELLNDSLLTDLGEAD